MSDSEPFEGWAIVELMGRRRLAGYVSEYQAFGRALLRPGVPADGAAHDDRDGFGEGVTRSCSPGAVYCLTPTTEDIARKVAARPVPAPVSRHELEPPRRSDDPWSGSAGDDEDNDPEGA